jgi:copper chaperone CopZ
MQNTFGVTGMTCAHCAHAVTEEVSELEGVSDVHVDLAPGVTSTLTFASTQGVDPEALRGAVKEAGDAYELADAPA